MPAVFILLRIPLANEITSLLFEDQEMNFLHFNDFKSLLLVFVVDK